MPVAAADVTSLLTNLIHESQTVPIHAKYLPVPPFFLAHAFRVSYGLRAAQYALEGYSTGKNLSSAQSFISPLILTFSGATISSVLLGEPVSWLYESGGLILYGGMGFLYHYYLSLFNNTNNNNKKPEAPKLPPFLLSVLFSFLDGHARTSGAVSFGPLRLAKLPLDSPLSNMTSSGSMVPTTAGIFLGGITALGGGFIFGPGLGLFKSEWSFSTPPMFKTNVITWGGAGLEVWPVLLSTILYPVLVSSLSLPIVASIANTSQDIVTLLGMGQFVCILLSSTILPRIYYKRLLQKKQNQESVNEKEKKTQ